MAYSKSSPYSKTSFTDGYLDLLNFVDLPEDPTDVQFTITSFYTYRPDLLAFDLYGDVNLWWVFAVRNKDTLRDSVFDFVPGRTIFLPKQTAILEVLK